MIQLVIPAAHLTTAAEFILMVVVHVRTTVWTLPNVFIGQWGGIVCKRMLLMFRVNWTELTVTNSLHNTFVTTPSGGGTNMMSFQRSRTRLKRVISPSLCSSRSTVSHTRTWQFKRCHFNCCTQELHETWSIPNSTLLLEGSGFQAVTHMTRSFTETNLCLASRMLKWRKDELLWEPNLTICPKIDEICCATERTLGRACWAMLSSCSLPRPTWTSSCSWR